MVASAEGFEHDDSRDGCVLLRVDCGGCCGNCGDLENETMTPERIEAIKQRVVALLAPPSLGPPTPGEPSLAGRDRELIAMAKTIPALIAALEAARAHANLLEQAELTERAEIFGLCKERDALKAEVERLKGEYDRGFKEGEKQAIDEFGGR